MITINITFSVDFTLPQIKALYELLRKEKDYGCLTVDHELKAFYHEITKLLENTHD